MAVFTAPRPEPVSQTTHWIDHLAYVMLGLIAMVLVVFLAAPLLAILQQALQNKTGQFIWLDNFIEYAKTPVLLESLWNSIWVSGLVALIAVPLAFGFAYALTRSCMPLKALFRGITLIPLLAPSLLSAISLIYWFGNQGVLNSWIQGIGIDQIYGAPGIVLAECFAVFPHALMILVTALSLSDARLSEGLFRGGAVVDDARRQLQRNVRRRSHCSRYGCDIWVRSMILR